MTDIGPSDATLELLSNIHALQCQSNEVIGILQGIEQCSLRLAPNQLVATIANARRLLTEQNRLIRMMVDAQINLDDRLRAIVELLPKD